MPSLWFQIIVFFITPFYLFWRFLVRITCRHKEWVIFTGEGRIYDGVCKRCGKFKPRADESKE